MFEGIASAAVAYSLAICASLALLGVVAGLYWLPRTLPSIMSAGGSSHSCSAVLTACAHASGARARSSCWVIAMGACNTCSVTMSATCGPCMSSVAVCASAMAGVSVWEGS